MKVLITGASSGIGKEMAKVLATKCDEMVLVAKGKTKLEEAKKEILAINGNLKISTTDYALDRSECCEDLFTLHKDVDLLINNAGFGDFGRFEETSLDKDICMINTNIVAVHILTKLYLKEMKKRGSGHILNVASIAGFMPGPLMATYYATKNYVLRLSEAIREELRRDKSKVKISVLCPGPVSTNFEATANVKFKVKGISSSYVAQYAIKHLNKFYIIPTFKIKLARFASHLASAKLTSKIVYNLQSKREKVEQ